MPSLSPLYRFQPMLHCFRLLLATCVTCFSIAGMPGEQSSLNPAAIAETRTETRLADPAESSENWAGWLALLVAVGGIAYGVKQYAVKRDGAKQQGVAETNPCRTDPSCTDLSLSEPKSDPSVPDPLNETALTETTLTETTRLTKADWVETLMANLHTLDADKRRQGIWELGQRGDSRALQPLVDLLMDSDSMQRSLILAAVSEIAVRSLKPMNRALMLSLQDQSPDVRINAIRDVTRIYDAMAQMSQLLQYAASDTHSEVRDTAQWALSQIDRIRSLPQPEALPSSPQIQSSAEQLPGEQYLEDQNLQR